MPAPNTGPRVVVSVTATESGDWQVVSTPTGFQGITTAAGFADNDYLHGFVRFENGEDWEEYDTEDDDDSGLMQISNITGTVTISRPATPYKSSNSGDRVNAGSGTHTLTISLGSGTMKRIIREVNGEWKTFTSADATPDVSGFRLFKTAGTTTITAFDNMEAGKLFIVRRGASDITIADGAGISLPNDEDITLTVSQPGLIFVEDNGVAYLVGTTGTAVLDEDDFASDSATQPPSQQSVAAYFARVPNRAAATELTIASGVIAPVLASHTVDTESDAASDDLDTITAGSFVAGGALTLAAANGARTVVLKHGTGNIVHPYGLDVSLDDAVKTAKLRYDGTNWNIIPAGADVLDEDDFASDSEALPPSQQSAAAYIASATAPAVDTGLLARTLLDRVGDEINVLDYFQDDEAAIVARIKARTATSSDAAATDAAIDAAYAAAVAGDAIIFPKGLYCTTSTHNFEKDFLTVEWRPGARVEHYGDTDFLVLRHEDYATSGTYLVGCSVINPFITRGDAATVLVAGIRLVNCSRINIVAPRIYHFPIRIQIEGGVYPNINSPQFRNSGPGISFQPYIAGSRLIGLAAHYYNDGSPQIKHCFQVTISQIGCDGVNVDYGILIEDSDGLQLSIGSSAVFKKAMIACVLDDDSSSVHQVDISLLYLDGGVTPHTTPHNIWIDGTNRPTASGGVWSITGGFIGNDLDGDNIPVLIERQNTSMTFQGGRSSSCDRALVKFDGGDSGGRLKFIGWTFFSIDTTTSGDGGCIVADSVDMIQVIGCSFEDIPSTPIKLLDTNGDIASAIFVGNTIINCGADIDRSGVTITDYVWTANTSDDSSPEADTTAGGQTVTAITPTITSSGGGAPTYTVQDGYRVHSATGGFVVIKLAISSKGSLAAGNLAISATGVGASAIQTQSSKPYTFGMTVTDVMGQLETATGAVSLYKYNGNTAPATLTVAEITDSFTFRAVVPFVYV